MDGVCDGVCVWWMGFVMGCVSGLEFWKTDSQ